VVPGVAGARVGFNRRIAGEVDGLFFAVGDDGAGLVNKADVARSPNRVQRGLRWSTPSAGHDP
jgi:hypothetical protein